MTRQDGEDPATFATELWTEAPLRQCPSGHADPGDSGLLPSMGKSLGAAKGATPRN